MPSFSKTLLAPAGSTGNNTHASATLDADAEQIGFQFVCEAIGATPAVTWKIQGSFDVGQTSDANAMWVDIPYITDATATEAVAARSGPIVANTAQVQWLALGNIRFFRRFRAVVTANTNVTYRIELNTRDSE